MRHTMMVIKIVLSVSYLKSMHYYEKVYVIRRDLLK